MAPSFCVHMKLSLSDVLGPSHMSLYLRVHQGATLSKWSLGDGTPVININGDYFVYYSHGLQAGPWHFWIELKVRGKVAAPSPPVLASTWKLQHILKHYYLVRPDPK